MDRITKISPGDSVALAQGLRDVLDGKLLAVRVENFLSRDLCDLVQQRIEKLGVRWYPNCLGSQGRIGIGVTEFSHRTEGKDRYFDEITAANQDLDLILNGSENPCDKLIKIIDQVIPTARAAEEGYGDYFCGLVRAMGAASTLHYDFAPTQARGWSIDQIDSQMAAVFYFSVPSSGGMLRIYERQWNPSDEVHNNDVIEKGPFGFSEKFISGVPYAELMPEVGEVIIFNSRNFHMVTAPSDGSVRYSMNAFLGRLHGSLVMWN